MAPYSDYVSHIIRFYVRNPQPEFRTEADRTNWLSVQKVMESLGGKERDTIMSVFAYGRLHDRVRDYDGVPDIIWQLIRRVSERVAQERGLI